MQQTSNKPKRNLCVYIFECVSLFIDLLHFFPILWICFSNILYIFKGVCLFEYIVIEYYYIFFLKDKQIINREWNEEEEKGDEDNGG